MTYDSADGSRSAVPASEKLACQARRSPFRLDRNENYETRCALAGSRLAIPYRWGFWAALVLVFAPTPIDARAADPAFVGTLALAVDPEVAQQLKIPPEVREKLQTIVDQRESEALELALTIKDLPADERAAQLRPFVLESERQGLALLSDNQRTRLAQMRIFRAGLASLMEPAIAEKLGLKEEQRAEIAQLLQSRAAELGKGTTQEREMARAKYERELAGKLTREQRTTWEQLAGIAAATPGDVATAKPPESEPAKPSGKEALPPERGAAPDKSSAKSTDPQGSSVAVGADGERRLKFNFRFAPWKDVLEWFATQADLSLILESPPPGTFNYTDTRTYSPEEAIDLLNGVLLTKGYVLLRRERLVLLLNLEDELPDPLVELVTPEELDKRGRFELVRCLFPIKKLTPEEAEKEISKLIGPQGKVMTLSQSKQLLIRETAGRLRAIRDLIAAVEDPEANRNDKLTVVQLKHMTTDELLIAARPLLGLPENINSAPDGAIRISPDVLNSRLLVSGKPDRVEKLEEIVKLLDVPSDKTVEPAKVEQPQLEIYTIGGADSNAVLLVMQTLMTGQADVRLAVDPKTGNLVALATPSQHATIRATLAEMQKDASDIEVFLLRRVDPQIVTVAINKLFGGDEKGAGTGAPKVESDPTARQLFVRGTPAQIAQVRSLLQKMGEGDTVAPGTETQDRGNVRTIPLSGRAAENVIQQLETLWPTVRPNRIRIVRPSGDTGNSAFKVKKLEDSPDQPDSTPRERDIPPELLELRRLLGPDFPSDIPLRDLLPRGGSSSKPATPAQPTPGEKTPVEKSPPAGKETPRSSDAPKPVTPPVPPRNAHFERARLFDVVAWQNPQGGSDKPTPPTPGPPAPPSNPGDKPVETPSKPAETKTPAKKYIPPIKAADPKKAAAGEEPAEIVISIQSGGIVIASQDTDALDAVEALLTTLGENAAGSGKEFTVFYLKYAPAAVAGALVQEILGGGGGDTGGGGAGGGSLLGDLASGMLGDMGGGLLGGLLGGGGGGGGGLASSGPITITPDGRLNALFVKASPVDLEMIEELLKIIDREASPENVQTNAPPRFIPVFNTSADEVATVVRQVYANRLVADTSQPRQPSPEDLLRALRGGGRGGPGGKQEAKSEPSKITIGVDARSNSLIVSAPEPLFQEIKAMVEQLDEAADSNRDEAMKIVTLKSANPLLIQRALQSITGGKARTGAATTGAAPPLGGVAPAATSGAPPSGFQPQQMQDEIRRRIESFNSQQGGGGRGGGGFPGGGFPGGGRGGRGGGR